MLLAKLEVRKSKLEKQLVRKQSELETIQKELLLLDEQIQETKRIDIQNKKLKNEIGLDQKKENELLSLIQKMSKGAMVELDDFKRIASNIKQENTEHHE